jgi:hypothetical protein
MITLILYFCYLNFINVATKLDVIFKHMIKTYLKIELFFEVLIMILLDHSLRVMMTIMINDVLD